MPKTNFKIAFFELESWEKEHLIKNLKNCQLQFIDDHLNEYNVSQVKDVDAIGVFIYSVVNKKILEMLPNLKLIATLSTGFEHIDIKECRKRKITVCNVPHYGENTVAEHTFALILCLTRKVHKAWERTRHFDFSISGLRGIDLKGKTLGVVGTGRIGRHVIRIANGFEMNVIAFDKFKDKNAEKELGFRYVDFNYILSHSNIITLHAPYTKETHHLINKKNIKKIKKGALLINTARGGLLETDALVAALDKKILSGAGLDVLEEECYIREDTEVLSKKFPRECDLRVIMENHILAEKENVIITPHNAFNSIEAIQRILDTTADNIKSFIKGKPIKLDF